jgi:hypothetical protein
MDFDGSAARHGIATDEVANAIDNVQAADDETIPVIAIDQRPYSVRVLSPDEVELLAIGLEQAATAIAKGPCGVWVQVILDEREPDVEFLLG